MLSDLVTQWPVQAMLSDLSDLSDLLTQRPVETAAALAALSGGTGYALYRYFLQRPLPGIPFRAESAGTFWGDCWAMRQGHPDKRRKWMAELPRLLGAPVVQIFLEPFSNPWVIVADFYEAADIVQRRTSEFDRSYRNFELFGIVIPEHHITMKSSDARFNRNKRLVKNLKSPSFLNQVSIPCLYTHTTALVELWTAKAEIAQGRPFEATQDLWSSSLDVIMAVAFGLDATRTAIGGERAHMATFASSHGAEPSEETFKGPQEPIDFGHARLSAELQSFVSLTDAVASAMRNPIPITSRVVYRFLPSHRAAVHAKDEMIRREIDLSVQRLFGDEVQQEQQDAGDGSSEEDELVDTRIRCAMDMMILAEKTLAEQEGRKPDYHSKTVRDELLGYLIGGHDTTSTTLAWLVKYVSANQPAQERLRNALRETHSAAVDEGRQPSCDEIAQHHHAYLDAVMEETLRLAGTIPMILRQATRDTEIMGHRIPKGTNIALLTQGPSFSQPSFEISNDKRTKSSAAIKSSRNDWNPEDMATFRPERWLKKVQVKSDDGTVEEKEVFDNKAGPSLPFGGGPRACFGRRLAMMELRIVITLLMWNFAFDKLPAGLDSMESLARMTNMPETCHVSLRRL